VHFSVCACVVLFLVKVTSIMLEWKNLLFILKPLSVPSQIRYSVTSLVVTRVFIVFTRLLLVGGY